MKISITELIRERFGDPIGRYEGDAPTGVMSIEAAKCPECGMKDCECDHINEPETCKKCGYMEVEEACGCTHKMIESKKNRGLWANIHAKCKAGK